jgi:hypothetical protein
MNWNSIRINYPGGVEVKSPATKAITLDCILFVSKWTRTNPNKVSLLVYLTAANFHILKSSLGNEQLFKLVTKQKISHLWKTNVHYGTHNSLNWSVSGSEEFSTHTHTHTHKTILRSVSMVGKPNTRIRDTPAHRSRNHTSHDIPTLQHTGHVTTHHMI